MLPLTFFINHLYKICNVLRKLFTSLHWSVMKCYKMKILRVILEKSGKKNNASDISEIILLAE